MWWLRKAGDTVDVVIISPTGEATMKELAQTLLELADSPADVKYVGWPEAGFAIPAHLFTRFEDRHHRGDDSGEDERAASEPVTAPKKRGRPRKDPAPALAGMDESEVE